MAVFAFEKHELVVLLAVPTEHGSKLALLRCLVNGPLAQLALQIPKQETCASCLEHLLLHFFALLLSEFVCIFAEVVLSLDVVKDLADKTSHCSPLNLLLHREHLLDHILKLDMGQSLLDKANHFQDQVTPTVTLPVDDLVLRQTEQ